MATSLEYRTLADIQRRAAEGCELPFVRELHRSSAQRFDALADEIEWCEPTKKVRRRAQQEIFF